MSKKIIIPVAFIVGLAIGFVLFQQSSGTAPQTSKEIAAKSGSDKPACSATKQDPSITIANKDRSNLETTVINQIIDVPAGTNVDIFISSYNGKVAQGSSIYAGNYGRYNYEAIKANNNVGENWKVTKFEACKG